MIITLDHCKELSDKELVGKSLTDLDYFSCLYQRYEGDLLRYIQRLSGIRNEESQDILQDAFVKIWRNLNEYDPGLKFSSWIYRIVHNETVSYLRKKKSFGKDRTQEIDQFNEILQEEPADKKTEEERALLTAMALEQLSIKYREVLVLKFYEKKSYEEISDILKIPEGTVAVRINRAKKLLREQFEKNP
jgi:RNA polymerase sigma-70 factor (ECF subfamily)